MTVHAVMVPGRTGGAPRGSDHVLVAEWTTSRDDVALARAADVLDRHPSVGTVFIGAERSIRQGVQPGDRWLQLAAGHGPDTVGSRWAVMRSDTYQAAGQQGLHTRRGELSLWLRAAALADVAQLAAQLPAAPPDRSVLVGQVTELHERAHAFRQLFEGFGPLRDRARLRSAVYRALARSARARARVAAYEGDRVESAMCQHLARDIDRWRRAW